MQKRNSHIAVLSIIVVAALAACQPDSAQSDQNKASTAQPQIDVFEATLVEDGQAIAERNCARCHAVGPEGESPMADAPPLRLALADFDFEALAIDFREHIKVGNDVMPEFDFNPLHVEALTAYLLTIEDLSDVE